MSVLVELRTATQSPRGLDRLPHFVVDDSPQRRLPDAAEYWPFLQEGAVLGKKVGAERIATLLQDAHLARTGTEYSGSGLEVYPCLRIDQRGRATLHGDPCLIGYIANGLNWAEVPTGPADPEADAGLLAVANLRVVLRIFGIEDHDVASRGHTIHFSGPDLRLAAGGFEILRGHIEDTAKIHGLRLVRFGESDLGWVLRVENDPAALQPMQPDPWEAAAHLPGPRTLDVKGFWAPHHLNGLNLYDQGYLLGLDLCPHCFAELVADALTARETHPLPVPIYSTSAAVGGLGVAGIHPFTAGIIRSATGDLLRNVEGASIERDELESAANHVCAVLELFAMRPHYALESDTSVVVEAAGEGVHLLGSAMLQKHLFRVAEFWKLRVEVDGTQVFVRRFGLNWTTAAAEGRKEELA